MSKWAAAWRRRPPPLGANGLNTAGGRYWWWGGAEDRNALVLAAGVDKAENRRTLLVGGM